MTRSVGIEKLSAYPGSLVLAMRDLCEARGHAIEDIRDTMMIDERSLNVPWEDPVTMAVNAALPMLEEGDRERIGLVIVASESGVDQEKPMSTWVHRFLELPPNVRNIEVKHACYGATAALQLAASWVLQATGPRSAALIINTDESRIHLGAPWEYVLGAGAVAILVSDNPKVLAIEPGASGVYTYEVSDLTRPTSLVETGNSETSLLSYLEALDGAFDDFLSRRPEAEDLDRYFARLIYHLPFGGMAYRAHKALLRRIGITGKKPSWEHFVHKSLPALSYIRRLGGTYGSSTFIGLMGMIARDNDLKTGDRLGIFSYGSGSCAEFWSGHLAEGAAEVVAKAGLDKLLDARRSVTVAEYERVERARHAVIDQGDFTTDRDLVAGWFAQHYQDKGLLIFTGVSEYYRQYAWS